MKNTLKHISKVTLGLVIALAIFLAASLASLGGVFTASAATDYSGLFNGGNGTSSNPFQIKTEQQLRNIGQISASDIASNYYYFQLTDNITLSDTESTEESYICTYFQGQIDGSRRGGQYSITSSNAIVYLSLYTCQNATFKNIIVKQQGGTGFFSFVCYGGFAGLSGSDSTQRTLTFDNIQIQSVNNNVPVQFGNNESSFVAIAKDGYVTFNDCVNNASLNYQTYGGIFLGGYTGGAKVSYTGCKNNGTVTGVKVGFFNGNTFNQLSSVKLVDENERLDGYTSVYVANCENNGTVTGTTSCSPFATNGDAAWNAEANSALTTDQLDCQVQLVKSDYLNSLTLALANGAVTITGAVSEEAPAVSYYTVSYYVQMNFYNENGGMVATSYVKVITTVAAADAATWSAGYVATIIGSNEYDETALEGAKYADLANENNIKEEAIVSAEYIIVNNTLIVNSADVLAKHNEFFLDATSVSLEAKATTYEVAAYQANGTVICCGVVRF